MGIAADGFGNVWIAESGVFVVGAEIQAINQSATITGLVVKLIVDWSRGAAPAMAPP
jgi:hypothetical protein